MQLRQFAGSATDHVIREEQKYVFLSSQGAAHCILQFLFRDDRSCNHLNCHNSWCVKGSRNFRHAAMAYRCRPPYLGGDQVQPVVSVILSGWDEEKMVWTAEQVGSVDGKNRCHCFPLPYVSTVSKWNMWWHAVISCKQFELHNPGVGVELYVWFVCPGLNCLNIVSTTSAQEVEPISECFSNRLIDLSIMTNHDHKQNCCTNWNFAMLMSVFNECPISNLTFLFAWGSPLCISDPAWTGNNSCFLTGVPLSQTVCVLFRSERGIDASNGN